MNCLISESAYSRRSVYFQGNMVSVKFKLLVRKTLVLSNPPGIITSIFYAKSVFLDVFINAATLLLGLKRSVRKLIFLTIFINVATLLALEESLGNSYFLGFLGVDVTTLLRMKRLFGYSIFLIVQSPVSLLEHPSSSMSRRFIWPSMDARSPIGVVCIVDWKVWLATLQSDNCWQWFIETFRSPPMWLVTFDTSGHLDVSI